MPACLPAELNLGDARTARRTGALTRLGGHHVHQPALPRRALARVGIDGGDLVVYQVEPRDRQVGRLGRKG